jgi:hypothetical protein
MHMPNFLPTVVPYGADQTVYLMLDSSGASRSDCPEKGIERDDLETIISDLLTGQFNAPVRVMAFNTLEHWIEDVSNQVAEEIQTRCDIDGVLVPEHVRDFVASHTGAIQRLHLGLIRNHSKGQNPAAKPYFAHIAKCAAKASAAS